MRSRNDLTKQTNKQKNEQESMLNVNRERGAEREEQGTGNWERGTGNGERKFANE